MAAYSPSLLAPPNPFTRAQLALAYPVGNYGTLSAISELDPLTRAHTELAGRLTSRLYGNIYITAFYVRSGGT
jgi:hypothetical protein